MRSKLVWLSLLVLLLTGCAAQPDMETGKNTEKEKEPAMEPNFTMTESSVCEEALPEERPEAQTAEEVTPLALSEEDVRYAYQQAVETWSWFELQPLPAFGRETEVDGCLYRRVDPYKMDRMEDLRIRLRSLFSEELTQQLLDSGGECPLYRSIGGELYVRQFGRERDWTKGDCQIQPEMEDERHWSVNVTVDLLGADYATVLGLEFWSFSYEWVEDRWVFTAFDLIY